MEEQVTIAQQGIITLPFLDYEVPALFIRVYRRVLFTDNYFDRYGQLSIWEILGTSSLVFISELATALSSYKWMRKLCTIMHSHSSCNEP